MNSLVMQKEGIEAFSVKQGFGPVDMWFTDERSGKNFDRAGYEALMAFCQANPQPRTARGRIICRDYDRFSRPVDEHLQVEPIEYQRQVILLHDLGWELDYVLTPRTGNAMLDGITGSIKALMSGEYLTKLSVTSRAGKRKAGMQGYWTGGPAPFPAARYNADDTNHGRPLERHMRAKNGQGVLGPDLQHPEYRTYWEDAAKKILAGATLDSIADLFDSWKVPQFYAGQVIEEGKRAGQVMGLSWRHANIFKVFTNTALVGRLEYKFTNSVDGSLEPHIGDAKWAPVVDEELFWAVRAELMKRRERGKRSPRNRDNFLPLQCYKCGARYVTAVWKSKTPGEVRRCYAHPIPAARMNEFQAKRTRKAGCKHWYIDSPQIEKVLRDVILEKRGSAEFYQSFADLMDQQDGFQQEAERLEEVALKNFKSLESQKERLKKSMRFADTDAEGAEIMAEIRSIMAEIEQMRGALDAAQLRVSSVREMNTELISVVEQAERMGEAWDEPGDEGRANRRRIVDTWVAQLWVEVIPVPGKPRSSIKRLHIVLNIAPDSPIVREFVPDYAGRARRLNPNTEQLEGAISSEMSPPNYSLFEPELVVLTLGSTKTGLSDILAATVLHPEHRR